jgi:hypothetical protein
MPSDDQLTSLSYPFAHKNSWIQNGCKTQDKLHAKVSDFAELPVATTKLRQLGDKLTPDEKDREAAPKVVRKIILALQQSDIVSVDRCIVSGSFRKRSAAGIFDIALIVFVDNAEPAFDYFLKDMRRFLAKALNGIDVESKTTRFSLHFILGRFEVDLLSTSNLIPNNTDEPAKMQRQYALIKLKETPPNKLKTDMRYWSAGLSESTVKYIKEQPSFANTSARICRLSRPSSHVTDSTFPLWFTSFLVEIYAIRFRQIRARRTPQRAFRVAGFSDILGSLVQTTSAQGNHDGYVSRFLANHHPLVMDPVNPYNNVPSQMGLCEAVRLLALSTLETMDANEVVTIQDIFRPESPTMFQGFLGGAPSKSGL